MPLVDIDALTRLLINTAVDVAEFGWDQPDLLFALHGPQDSPELRYVLQLPGRPSVLLRDLLEAGVRARPGIAGLVLTTGSRQILFDVDDVFRLPIQSGLLLGDRDAMVDQLTHAWDALRGQTVGHDDTPPARAAIALLRDGTTVVVAHRLGEGGVHVVEALPRDIDDHEEVAQLAMRMLVGDHFPLPHREYDTPRMRIA